MLINSWEVKKRGKNPKEIASWVQSSIQLNQMIFKIIGNTLNKYFSSIKHRLASDIPEVDATLSDYPDPPLQSTFYFDPVIPHKIESEIGMLPNNKALELYSSPVRLLKISKSIICRPL